MGESLSKVKEKNMKNKKKEHKNEKKINLELEILELETKLAPGSYYKTQHPELGPEGAEC